MDDLLTKTIAEAHGSTYSIHPGSTKMYHDLKEIYWWDGINKDIAEYVAKCTNCKHVKEEHLNLGGLTQLIKVHNWKLESINMEFVVGLLRTRRKHDSIWVIMDRLTKSAHFIPVKSTYRAEDYARHCIDDIVKWNMIYWSIISYREAQFTSHF